MKCAIVITFYLSVFSSLLTVSPSVVFICNYSFNLIGAACGVVSKSIDTKKTN